MQSWLLSLLARQTILIGTESNNSILKSKLINLIPKYLKYQGKTLPLRRIKIFKRNQIGTLKGHPVYPRSQSTNYYLHVLSERYFFNLLFKIITDFIITWAIFSSALLSLFWIVRVLPPAPPPPLYLFGVFLLYSLNLFCCNLVLLILVPSTAELLLSANNILLFFTAAFSVFEDSCNISSGLLFSTQSKLFQSTF